MYGSRPLAKLEAALYVLAVSALVLVLLDRMLVYFEYAERAAVEATLLRTQSALHTRLAYDILRGKAPNPAEWSTQNPFKLAQMKLENFAGERDAADSGVLEGGQWVYDRTTRHIVYKPRYSRGLSIEGGGVALRFRLGISQDGLPRLEPVERYRWEP